MGRLARLRTVCRPVVHALLVPTILCLRAERLITLDTGNIEFGHNGRGTYLVSDRPLGALAHGAQAGGACATIGAEALIRVAVRAARASALFADRAARQRRLLNSVPACKRLRRSGNPFPMHGFHKSQCLLKPPHTYMASETGQARAIACHVAMLVSPPA